jgi:hypothetical protein
VALIPPTPAEAVTPPGAAVTKMRINTCAPETGGVMFVTATVPVRNVINPTGTIDAALATVTGYGIRLFWTVLKFWKDRSGIASLL